MNIHGWKQLSKEKTRSLQRIVRGSFEAKLLQSSIRRCGIMIRELKAARSEKKKR